MPCVGKNAQLQKMVRVVTTVLQERKKIEIEFIDTRYIVIKRQGSDTELSGVMLYHQLIVFERVFLPTK
jgi:hypothetical protein